MTFTITLTPEKEARLRYEAEAHGLAAEELARRLIEEGLPEEVPAERERPRRSATAELIQSWIDEGDEQEQQETFEILRQELHANHAPFRTVFP